MSESRRDHLIDRLVAGEAGDVGFREFEILARQDSSAWEHLARALRDELQLRAALAGDIDSAAIEAEVNTVAARIDSVPAYQPHAPSLRMWTGWAAAACLALVWIAATLLPTASTDPRPTNPASNQANSGGVVPVSLTADDALNRYLETGREEGRLLAELPAIMVESRSTDDGGLEVYYVRQFLEREHVQEVYEVGTDEDGNAIPVPVSPASWESSPMSL